MSKQNKLTLKLGRELLFINIDDIVLIKAENIYCNVYLKTKQHPIFVSQTLKELQLQITADYFFKTHRSFIINVNYIERYVKIDLSIHLQCIDFSVPISRALKQKFEKLIR